MPIIFFQIAALATGILLSVQVGLNNKLRVALGSPVVAAIISFLVGLVFLAITFVGRRETFPSFKALGQIPPYVYIGGLLGAVYVTSATVLFARLGALQTTGLVVAGQIVASLIIDHYGLLGAAVQPIGLTRIIAAALVVGGVVLAGRG